VAVGVAPEQCPQVVRPRSDAASPARMLASSTRITSDRGPAGRHGNARLDATHARFASGSRRCRPTRTRAESGHESPGSARQYRAETIRSTPSSSLIYPPHSAGHVGRISRSPARRSRRHLREAPAARACRRCVGETEKATVGIELAAHLRRRHAAAFHDVESAPGSRSRARAHDETSGGVKLCWSRSRAHRASPSLTAAPELQADDPAGWAGRPAPAHARAATGNGASVP